MKALLLVAALCLSLMGASCGRIATDPANAISPACKEIQQTLQVCAYANYGTFVVAEELARSVAEDPALPNGARQAIVAADARAKPIADNLSAALLEYETIRLEVAVGKSPEQKLLLATANLNRWVTEAAPLIRGLVAAVTAGTKGKSK